MTDRRQPLQHVEHLTGFQNWWQVLSTAVLTIAGLAFVCGFLIVNIRLARFGVYSTGLAKAEYVLAGGLYLFLVAITAAAFHYFRRGLEQAGTLWRERRYLRATWDWLFYAFVFVSVPNYVILTASGYDDKFFLWHWRGLACVLLLASPVAYGYEFRNALFAEWPVTSGGDALSSRQQVVRAVSGLIAKGPLVSIVIHVSVYAHFIYPSLLPAFGGGHRDPLLLVVTQEGAEAAQHLVLPISKDNRLVGPVEPLWESGDELVLLVKTGQGRAAKANAVRFRRSLYVAAVNVPDDHSP